MTITGGSALPKDEIDRMIKEAEAHAEEDRKRREEAEVRNNAEQLAYQVEKVLKENEDKVPADVATEVTDAIAAVRTALEGTDAEAIKSAAEELSQKSMKIGEALAAAAQADAAGAGSEGAAPADDDVVDAEVVEDEDDKA